MTTKIAVPVLALGGEVGSAPDLFERMKPLGIDVRGGLIPRSGHYIPEEEPEALVREISSFAFHPSAIESRTAKYHERFHSRLDSQIRPAQ